MAGVHLTVQPKNSAATDVYLGPTAFIKIFKTNFPTGAPVQVIGAKAGDVILAREVTEGATSITLRDADGSPVWENWGVSAPTSVTGD
jgi:hypothetical protein